MIVQILSAAYSGSTLLDALLDSQPEIHGLGECAQCWESKPLHPASGAPAIRGPCHICGTEAKDCTFWSSYFTEGTAGRCAATWAAEKLGARFVVDASKAAHRFHPGSSLPKAQILLAKAPHEWVSSVLGHDGKLFTLQRAWEYWEELHTGMLEYLDRHAERPPLFVQYRELTSQPAYVLREVCAWLLTYCDPGVIDDGRMWQRKSHALGGNPAVIDQLGQTESYTGGREKWMGGKYSEAGGLWRAIRYDDAWRRDESLRQQCRELYLAASGRMCGQLERLGFGTSVDLANSMLP